MTINKIATTAIMNQSQKISESAKKIASMSNNNKPEVNLAQETVNIIEAQNLTKANINVIKSEDERIKSLLDIFI